MSHLQGCFSAKPKPGEGGFCHEEEAIHGRADRGDFEASGPRNTDRRTDMLGRRIGTDLLPVEEEVQWTGGRPDAQVKQLQENVRVKRLVADLTLDKAMWQDALSRKSLAVSSCGNVLVRGLPDRRAAGLPGDMSEPRDVLVQENTNKYTALLMRIGRSTKRECATDMKRSRCSCAERGGGRENRECTGCTG